jgi:hypothetical protein
LVFFFVVAVVNDVLSVEFDDFLEANDVKIGKVEIVDIVFKRCEPIRDFDLVIEIGAIDVPCSNEKHEIFELNKVFFSFV